MTTIVTHSCGHQQSHALFGMFAADTERKARQLARRKCTACYQGAKAAQGDADAALLDGITPAILSGSDKQASWAGTIRAKRIAALLRSGADDTVIHALAALTDAKWWIDHRGASDAELIATATAPAS